ncbi:MAG: hypothetical protein KJN62_10100 [Deltaproteobacteria bacterium]|nr:hypothetical protein [Deltaproteobacteria bacterium]
MFDLSPGEREGLLEVKNIIDFREGGDLMPLYQFFCENCWEPFELTMKLKELDQYDSGKLEVNCPKCTGELKKLICPPRTITIN